MLKKQLCVTQERLSKARDVFEGHEDEDQLHVDLGFDSMSESDENDDC